MLISTYCIDRLVGIERNTLRNIFSEEIDKGIGNLVIKYIISNPDLLCKAFKKYTGISFDILTVNAKGIPKKALEDYPWLMGRFFMIINGEISAFSPSEEVLENAVKIFNNDFIKSNDFQVDTAVFSDIYLIIHLFGCKKILIANI